MVNYGRVQFLANKTIVTGTLNYIFLSIVVHLDFVVVVVIIDQIKYIILVLVFAVFSVTVVQMRFFFRAIYRSTDFCFLSF